MPGSSEAARISALPAATALTDTEVFPGSQGGVEVKFTRAQILSGGVPDPFTLGVKSGRYYHCTGVTEMLAAAITADRLYATPFYVPEPTTWTEIGIEVTTEQADSSLRLGIYNAAGGLPTTLALDAGEVSSATTGEKTKTISKLLATGYYYLAFVGDDAVEVNFGVVVNQAGLIGATDAAFAVTDSLLYRAFTYAALPSPFGGTPVYVDGTQACGMWLRK